MKKPVGSEARTPGEGLPTQDPTSLAMTTRRDSLRKTSRRPDRSAEERRIVIGLPPLRIASYYLGGTCVARRLITQEPLYLGRDAPAGRLYPDDS
jgi:hypothetical protein